jgi:hypothetical protein
MERAESERGDLDRLRQIYIDAVDMLFEVGYAAADEEYRRLRNLAENARFDLKAAELEYAIRHMVGV